MLIALSAGADEVLAALAQAESDVQIDGSASGALRWAESLAVQCRAGLEEVRLLAPWIESADATEPFTGMPSLRDLAEHDARIAADLGDLKSAAQLRLGSVENIAERLDALAQHDYSFLYDRSRHLLRIGYNVDEHRLDASYYDLLASEARLAASSRIAQGQLPQEHWFALGPAAHHVGGGEPTLLSWSGSMFEYLMPLLVMPSYDDTLLDQTCAGRRAAADRVRPRSAACRGASPSRATTRPTRS